MCIHVYQCFKSIFFNFNFLISPPPPPPFEKFSRYDLQPITEQQDPTVLLNPVISFFMSLEWWHEQMTFHLRVKQVYIYKTHCTFLWVSLMRCLGGGGNMKMEEFNLSSSHLLTRVTFISRKCINFMKTNWSLI